MERIDNQPNISPVAELNLQYALLKKEYEYEKETYRQQTERMGIGRKVRQGLCWYPVGTGRSYYNSLDQFVVEVIRTEEREVEHAFEHGRPVRFFRVDTSGGLHYLNFTATISYVKDDRMVVALPSPAALAEVQSAGLTGIQLFFDETSYRIMFAALTAAAEAKGTRLAALREVLLGRVKSGWRELFPVRFPWLNRSQEAAVNRVLAAKDVTIVHGPPGTGKTTTLVEAVYETLHRENQVLVCAQSNTAVDWIAEKLADRGIAVLRIGNPTRVNDKMLSFTYERRFEAHPDYAELWGVRKAIRETQAGLRNRGREGHDGLRNRLSKLRSRETELELRIRECLFGEARVIASTLVGAGNRLLDGRHFTTLFIDEAAQALEAACWIPAAKADRVILAGDHCQLPPTIKCVDAARGGLENTLMQKIATRKPETVSLLSVQYRMNEEIMGFPSRWFYHGKLTAAPEVKHRGILEWDLPMVWTDTSEMDFGEEMHADSMSRVNPKEAELLVSELKRYAEKIGKERILEEHIDFGVISPYKAQVQYIRGLIKRDAFFKPLRGLITIHTVDGFQGQERDVVLISLVRANAEGQIGFLGDLRRMNVAITRARMKLIILGDASTLARHRFYRELYQYIQNISNHEKLQDHVISCLPSDDDGGDDDPFGTGIEGRLG